MQYSFHAWGHPNITGSHRNTFEFTKEKSLSKQGHCIIGIKANFSTKEIKKFFQKSKSKTIEMTIKVNNRTEKIIFTPNKTFSDGIEIVMRKTDFESKRTLGIFANKAAKDLRPELIKELKNQHQKIEILMHSR